MRPDRRIVPGWSRGPFAQRSLGPWATDLLTRWRLPMVQFTFGCQPEPLPRQTLEQDQRSRAHVSPVRRTRRFLHSRKRSRQTSIAHHLHFSAARALLLRLLSRAPERARTKFAPVPHLPLF